jgi:hypothetical protein
MSYMNLYFQQAPLNSSSYLYDLDKKTQEVINVSSKNIFLLFL